MNNIILVLALFGSYVTKCSGWACENRTGEKYCRPEMKCDITFNVRSFIPDRLGLINIRFYNGSIYGNVFYDFGPPMCYSIQGTTLTADFSGNITLTLLDVQMSNAGTFVADVIRYYKYMQCVTLYVFGEPEAPYIISDNIPEVTESVTLTCYSNSTTMPSNHSLTLSYIWKVGIVENPTDSSYAYLQANKYMTIYNLTKHDSGVNVACRATESGGGYTSAWSKTYVLTVFYGPENISFSSGGTYVEGAENTTLPAVTCNAECNPACSFKWTKINPGVFVSNFSDLQLGRLDISKAGTYRCIATRNSRSAWIDLTVNVIHGPDTLCNNVSSVLVLTEGDDAASIRCSTDCFPGCSYTWYNGSTIVGKSEEFSLREVRRFHAGNYTLKSSNTDSVFKKSIQRIFQINVKYPPDVRVSYSTLDHTEGSSLTLFCNGYGVPVTNFYSGFIQTIGSVVIPNTHHSLVGTEARSSLYFPALQLQDTGNFTCLLNNGIKDLSGRLEQSGVVNLLVKGRPKLLQDSLSFTGELGGSISIRVSFYSYPIEESVHFVRYDGQRIEDRSEYSTEITRDVVHDTFYGQVVQLDGRILIIRIFDLKEEDFANYTLTIQNKWYSTDVVVYIVAESIPGIPRSFNVIEDSRGLAFIWEKGFNGGYSQTFVIEVFNLDNGKWKTLDNISENNDTYRINSTFYRVNIAGLNTGIYTARLTAGNVKGRTFALDLNGNFIIESELENVEKSSNSEVAGGISGAVIFVVVVVVITALFFRKRLLGGCKRDKSNARQDKDSVGPENDYYNLNRPEQCDLQMSDFKAYVSTYETLQGHYENCRNDTYADLHHVGTCPSTSNSKPSKRMQMDHTYENTK